MNQWLQGGTGIQIGGDVNGLVAGGDIHYNSVPQEPVAEYKAAWSWKSPVTMATLTWLSTVLGVLGVIAGWQGLKPFFSLLSGSLIAEGPPSVWPIAVFAALLCGVLAALGLRRVVKHRTQWFPPVSWLPVVTGWGGHLGLARLEGTCPRCGGKLRFYDKPTGWRNNPETGRREVAERTMAAECTRNSAHWWSVDKTDDLLG
ncbi:hypothetical protein BST43_06565 [Mycobacteroides saopaulense]|uniref:Uncharacterized protein n=1 Tax=Mycobacteroides saopaulense TaxID=1578165 RepID=A0A1X0JB16_9MYCO|nr:hypothetical protein [Mycobacteroides saopaulense]ORB59655.1 hypothetical protein BST43_06565 [Mycobacteroides saopaulense]